MSDIEFIHLIGIGSYGSVHMLKIGDAYYAGKYLFDTADNGISNPAEIDIFTRLDHPNICHALSLRRERDFINKFFSENPNFGRKPTNGFGMIIIMPISSNYDLVNYLGKGAIKIDAVVDIMHQIVCGIEFMHRHRILHLDLKAGNILAFVDESNKISGVNIKITDFGTCAYTTKALIRYFAKEMTTLNVRPPELFDGHEYSGATDMWSIGIIFLELIMVCSPFTDFSDPMKVLKDIKRIFDPIHIRHNLNVLISNEKIPKGIQRDLIIDFICKLLQLDPRKRINAQDALKHQLFSNYNTNIKQGYLIAPIKHEVNCDNITADVYMGIERIINYCKNIDTIRTETVFLAISLFWRMYATKQDNNYSYIKLISVSSFWLATKMIEPSAIHLQKLASMVNLPASAIIDTECQIIFNLKGIIYPWNVFNYSDQSCMVMEGFNLICNPYKYYTTDPISWSKTALKMNGIDFRKFNSIINGTEWGVIVDKKKPNQYNSPREYFYHYYRSSKNN